MERSNLQILLVELLGTDNVYFQPPSNIQLKYPCIIYQREYVHMQYADNSPYKNKKRYQVTVVDQNPDSEIPDKIAALPLCFFNRFFVSDGLNHDIYHLYY